jgi:hypothetical protein
MTFSCFQWSYLDLLNGTLDGSDSSGDGKPETVLGESDADPSLSDQEYTVLPYMGNHGGPWWCDICRLPERSDSLSTPFVRDRVGIVRCRTCQFDSDN